MYDSDISQSITQVVMNLPSEAAEFLGCLFGQDHSFFICMILYIMPHVQFDPSHVSIILFLFIYIYFFHMIILLYKHS